MLHNYVIMHEKKNVVQVHYDNTFWPTPPSSINKLNYLKNIAKRNMAIYMRLSTLDSLEKNNNTL
jgi:hypothetical protein